MIELANLVGAQAAWITANPPPGLAMDLEEISFDEKKSPAGIIQAGLAAQINPLTVSVSFRRALRRGLHCRFRRRRFGWRYRCRRSDGSFERFGSGSRASLHSQRAARA
jgi:hypothetical protein